MRKSKSYKSTLMVGYVLLAIIPIILVGGVSDRFLLKSLEKEITQKNSLIAASLASEVDTYLDEPRAILEQTRALIYQRQLLNDSQVDAYLESVVTNYPIFEMLQYIDSNGVLLKVAPADYEYLGNSLSNQPFYKHYKEGAEFFWSPTFISMQTGQATITLSLSCPEGLLVGYINLKFLHMMISTVEINKAMAIITDQEGTVIAHQDQQVVQERVDLKKFPSVRRGLDREEGTFVEKDGDREVMLSISRVKQTGWLIIFQQDLDDAYMPVKNNRWFVVAVIAITAMVAIFAAIYSLRKMLTALDRLVADTKGVAEGDYKKTFHQSKYKELIELENNFQLIIEAVQNREAGVKESERLYRNLIESIPYGIQENDLHGIIKFTNRVFDEIFEIDSGEALGSPVFFVEPTLQGGRRLKKYFDFLVRMQPDPKPYFTKAKTKSGRLIDIQIDWQYKRDLKGILVGFIAVITDCTEKKVLEENLRQAQKLEAVGTLAGGIAHDFNNILTAILGYAELVLDNLDDGGDDKDDQREIIHAALRAKELIKHLLIFSRKQEKKTSVVDVEKIVKEALALLRASLPSTIIFKENVSTDVGLIEADPTQIHQIIMNLCTNAAHAMDGKGVLEISLDSIEGFIASNEKSNKLHGGRYVILRVADSGVGIEKEHLDKIFDPFFTTKNIGDGTGMGLAVVHGIVNSHGGFVEVISTPGEGTEVQVLFPVSASEEVLQAPGKILVRGQGEHILVVDDEETIANMNKARLERLGYKVTRVTSSVDALERVARDPDRYKLILSDQTMPHMTGAELMAKVRKLNAQLPFILCTGYSEIMDEEMAVSLGANKFLMKPVYQADLASAVREVLSV